MKHLYGLRMLDINSRKPLEKLCLYEAESQQLTLDDFIRINSKDPHLQLICPFYIGFMSIEDVFKKYDKDLFH